MSMAPAYHQSLPYIDKDPSEQSLAAARALIAAEATAATSPSPSTLLPPSASESLKLSPALTTELQRVSSSTPLSPLDLSRYEAQEPLSTTGATNLLPPLQNAAISSTYLSSRAQNLALLDAHGKNAWLLGNNELEAELRRLEAELAEIKADVDKVNVERRRRQEEVRGEMELLEDGWRKGVGRVLETEVAVEELRAKIREELKNA
ncbi:breast carcinoma amplified sequence 2 (BCAS2) domain-containing protein [Sarocladium implicatum]|nr:breast carcinoma amplified sequence 2 (BCAS2) domain-containing protein [Sarocladium implicatum]